MVQLRTGFISGQTGDGCEKPESESPESQENRKSGGTRKWKVKKYHFPMWFEPIASKSALGVDLDVNDVFTAMTA